MARIPSPAGLVRYQRAISTRYEGVCTFCAAPTVPGVDFAALNGKGKWLPVCATCAASVTNQVKGIVSAMAAEAEGLSAEALLPVATMLPTQGVADVVAGTLTDAQAYDVLVALGHARNALKAIKGATPAPAASKPEVTAGLYLVNGEPWLAKANRQGTNLYAMRLSSALSKGTKPAWEYVRGGMRLIADQGVRATADEAAAIGHLTSHCCFCGLSLSDEGKGRSVEVGYGPVCAAKNGLPWG